MVTTSAASATSAAWRWKTSSACSERPDACPGTQRAAACGALASTGARLRSAGVARGARCGSLAPRRPHCQERRAFPSALAAAPPAVSARAAAALRHPQRTHHPLRHALRASRAPAAARAESPPPLCGAQLVCRPPRCVAPRRSYGGHQIIGPFKRFTAVIGPNGARPARDPLRRLPPARRASLRFRTAARADALLALRRLARALRAHHTLSAPQPPRLCLARPHWPSLHSRLR